MAKKAKAPKIRFASFTSDWRVMPLGSLFKNRRETAPKWTPVYSVTIEGGLVPRQQLERKMNDDAEDNLYVASGDIAYNMMRMWQGAMGIANTECAVSPAYIVLQPVENTNSTFFTYLFRSEKSQYQITSYSYGITSDRLRLYYKDFASIKMSVPALPEQQKIASFFTTIDKKLQLLKKQLQLLEQYKKGVMQQIFSQQLRFKNDKRKLFPEWEKKKLGEISERIVNKNKGGGENVLTISAEYGLISQLDFFSKSVAGKDLSNYYLLNRDDFAYNKSYSNGYPMGAIKRLKLYDVGVVSTLYICFRMKREINVDYMEHYFNSGCLNKEIEKHAQEGARNHGLLNIGVMDFFSVDLLVPSPAEQTKIASFLSAIDDKINTVRQQLTLTGQWKKGLLQQMFV